MTRRPIALLLLGLAACSDSPDNPDAPPGSPDAPPGSPDAPPTVDAPGLPDAHQAKDAPPAVDANAACGADQLCLNITPVDGTTPPPGRLAVAWMPQAAAAMEIAYDQPWAANQVTGVDLTAIASPGVDYQLTDLPFCPGGRLAIGTAIASTDPNGDGAISAAELENGFTDNSNYGVLQAVVAWTDIGCPVMNPDFPEGLQPGVHVYTIDEPVMRLDGTLIDFQTCTPGTAACDNINFPF